MTKVLNQILRSFRNDRPQRRKRSAVRPIDSLEERILPTAVVSFTGTAMTITSDTNSNVISVTRIGNQVLVDANGGLITVAGSDVPSFLFNLNGAFNLTAKFSDGNDVLSVGGGLQLRSATVSMGDGVSNQVVFTDATLTGKLTINTENGADTVILQNTSVTGTTVINTGWNNDMVQIFDGSFVGTTTINTDLGADSVTILGTASRTKFGAKLTVTTGDDVDAVQMIKLDTKAISVDTGDSTDLVVLADILAGGAVSVKTGAGIDQLQAVGIIQSGSGANVFDLGSDADVLLLAQSSFAGATTIDLGSGTANSATIDDLSFNSTFTLNSKGSGDVIAVETNTAMAGQTTFSKAAKFNLGLISTVALGTADPASVTKFLSSSAFSAVGTPNSNLLVTVANVSFFSPPVLKKVTRTDI